MQKSLAKNSSPLSSHQALIFDLDGVLIDSEPLHIAADKIACKRNGMLVPDRYWERHRGEMASTLFARLLHKSKRPDLTVPSLVSEKQAIFLSLARNSLRPIPGALEFLAHARDLMPQLALATSSGDKLWKLVRERFQLRSCFDQVITGDQVRQVKPHPETYRLAANRLRLRASECLVIEDSVIGVTAARAAGCTVIGIAGAQKRSRLAAAGAHFIVQSFFQIALPTKSYFSDMAVLSSGAEPDLDPIGRSGIHERIFSESSPT